MQKTKILLVEDDELASELIYDFLEEQGFEVLALFSATDAIAHALNESFDIVLLDINLPDFDGYEVLKKLQMSAALPIIITSAFSDTQSKLKAFKYGASDYMVKPLDLEELEARIWVQLSKTSKIQTPKKERQTLFMQTEEQIFFKGEALELTATEFSILKELLKNKNRLLNRSAILASLPTISTQRSLDNHIKNIRKKLGENSTHQQYLKTIYGAGYMLSLKDSH